MASPSQSNTIMVVDDTPANLKLLEKMLKEQGYRVRSFPRGAMTPAATMPKVRILYVDDDIENLNSFKAVFRRIYDVHLAVSAQEALDILRETDIPVILCTGYNKNISETRAAEIGIRTLLMKPLTKTVLAKTVRNVLDVP